MMAASSPSPALAITLHCSFAEEPRALLRWEVNQATRDFSSDGRPLSAMAMSPRSKPIHCFVEERAMHGQSPISVRSLFIRDHGQDDAGNMADSCLWAADVAHPVPVH